MACELGTIPHIIKQHFRNKNVLRADLKDAVFLTESCWLFHNVGAEIDYELEISIIH